MAFRCFSLRLESPLACGLLLFLLVLNAAFAAPAAPSNLRGSVLTNTSFAIYWDDNSTDETSFYLVYSVNGTSQTPVSLGSNPGTGTIGRLFSGLTGWNTAVVQIRATNASGSTLSNSVNLTFNVAFNAPNTPLTRSFADGTALFMWTDNSSAESGYIAEIATASGGPYSAWGNTGANVTDISGALAPSTTYYFRVKAFQGTAASPSNSSAYTSVVSVTTPVLAPPTGLTATATSETAITLSWTDHSAVEQGYAVYYKPSSSGTYTLIGYASENTTSYPITGFAPGTSYDFQVAAAYQLASIVESARSTASATTKDAFTSRTFHPITYNQPFSYQAAVSSGSARSAWSITNLPTGLSFNTTSGLLSGTPSVTGVFTCPMTATFANGWTTNTSLTLRIIRAPGAPVTTTSIGSQTLAAGGGTSVSLTGKFSDPDSESAVRLVTNLGSLDFILYQTATPQTVTNFLSYVNNASSSGNYNGAVFHRSVPGFVIQGGGYKVQSAPNNFTAITKAASPVNEPGIAHLRGTVAMAKLGNDPNSATDEFFVNLSDNRSQLDDQNGGFTAFARVAGNGMAVADAIASLNRVNATVYVDGTSTSSLTDWPVTSGSTMDTSKMVTITSAAPVAVLSYSITGNTNPSAVSAGVSGTTLQLTGVAGGQSNVTVTATDLDGNTTAQTFTVTVNQVPAFTSSAPSAPATLGAGYNFSYTATGFPAPEFAVTSGSLPPGLSLSTTGVISGTPNAVGIFTGTVSATSAAGSATQNFSITVNQVPAFTNGPPPTAGSLDSAYNFSYAASGSPAPEFSVTAGALPSGLSFSGTGVISGTPSAAGVFAGTVTATNAAGSASQDFHITVPKLPATVTIGSLSQIYNGTARPVTIATSPASLNVTLTYNGSSSPPTDAGTYAVLATVNEPNYAGSASNSLVIAKATASVTVAGLAAVYDGSPKPVTVSTTPPGLTVHVTYSGSITPPSTHGSYPVTATIADANYLGSQNAMLVIEGQSATEWQADHFTTEQIAAGLAADDADPDGDGLGNLAEYALGSDPLSPGPSLAPTRNADGLTLIFTRPKDLPNVTYAAESSDNLGAWNPVPLEVTSDGPVQTIRARDPLTSGNPARRFMRLLLSPVSP